MREIICGYDSFFTEKCKYYFTHQKNKNAVYFDLPPKIRTINSRTDNDIVSGSVLLISLGFDGGYNSPNNPLPIHLSLLSF